MKKLVLILALVGFSAFGGTLSWWHDNPGEVAAFEINRSTNIAGPFSPWATLTNITGASSTNFAYTAHIPSGNNFFYIRAFGTNGFPSDPSTNVFQYVVGPGQGTRIRP